MSEYKNKSELAFEKEVIEYLTHIGGVKQWEYLEEIKTTEQLWDNQGAGQSVEIQCESIEIYGLCGNDYPMQKKGQSFEDRKSVV